MESVGRETIRATLKRTKLKPHLKKQWCIPAKSNTEFVARMEDVLETYALPYDPEIPLICMDEQPIQILEDSRPSEPMKAGQVRREDYKHVRKGGCSVFLFTEPLAGRRHVHAWDVYWKPCSLYTTSPVTSFCWVNASAKVCNTSSLSFRSPSW